MNFIIVRKDDGHSETVSAANLEEACERISEGRTRELASVSPTADDAAPATAIVVPVSNPTALSQLVAGSLVGTVPVSAGPRMPPTDDDLDDAPPAPLQNSTFSHTIVDDAAKTRIEAQHAALARAGVTVNTAEQFFATGTRMADIGYETQEARKREHDRKERLADAAARLVAVVKAEGREDVTMTAGELISSLSSNGKVTALGGLALTEQAIRGISTRLESPMLGYVLGIRDRIMRASYAVRELRAGIEKGTSEDTVADRRTIDGLVNAMNSDRRIICSVLAAECRRSPDTTLKLRTRRANKDVFAVTSPGYATADAPEVVDEIVSGLPGDARGSWSYDPVTTSWELRALVWTETPVARQAVGEPFEGYASFQSRDNGTSRFRGGGGVTLLRCLNASTYVADGVHVSRMHRAGIRLNLDAMVDAARGAIDALCTAWGESRKAELAVSAGVPISEAIPGFWRHCLMDRRSELAGVLPGRSDSHIDGLTAAFHQERRVSDRLVRSDLAQGWTRYIQSQPTAVRREAEIAVGEWLHSGSKVACDLRA